MTYCHEGTANPAIGLSTAPISSDVLPAGGDQSSQATLSGCESHSGMTTFSPDG
jgi:hypothetical protein